MPAAEAVPPAKPESKIGIADRILLRFSRGHSIDGLWLGTFEGEPSRSVILGRLEAALGLIRTHDPVRYGRIRRDLDRVWVRYLPGPIARYRAAIRACEMDPRFVLGETTTPEEIAAVVVHEATHARLVACGIGYEETWRHRIERACYRRERAFALRVPDNARILRQADAALTYDPASWTPAALQDLELEGGKKLMNDLGFPTWLQRLLLRLRALRQRRPVG